jgi:hypothetical protein
MGSAYTPGLKVTRSTIVRKVRKLPLKGDVLVQKGQTVKPHDEVAKTFLPGEPVTMNLAQIFNYDVSMAEEIQMLKELLVVEMGQEVKKGDLLAKKKGLFGIEFFATKVQSPISGVIDSLSEITGQLTIRKPPVPIQMEAYIPGEVIDVLPEEGVVVETHAGLIQGIFGVGGEAYGEIMVVASSPDQVLTADMITPACKDKIVVGGSLVTAEALRKAGEVGCTGIVGGGIIDVDLIEYLGYDIGVAITGTEDIPITLILTEGFGEIRMATKTFNMLKEFNGRMASINGATQIRAGVMRPEIIVANDTAYVETKSHIEEGGMGKDTLIRIIRAPYFGQIATVESLPPELQQVESETWVRVLFAKLGDGSVVRVPRANVELIEE